MDLPNIQIYKLSKITKFINNQEFNPPKFESSTPNKSKDQCNDKCQISFTLSDNKITNPKLHHRGCILSKAVANALLLSLEHRTVSDASEILDSFYLLMKQNITSPLLSPELLLFQTYNKYPTRIYCILSSVDAIKLYLDESQHP